MNKSSYKEDTFMKLNLKVRIKNPWFWIGIVGVILTALNVDPSTFTSWGKVWECVVDLFTNPFKLGVVVIAVLGIFVDPTTVGISDSKQAMKYISPKKDSDDLTE